MRIFREYGDSCAAIFDAMDKEKGLSISAKPLFYLVEAGGFDPPSRKPTFYSCNRVMGVVAHFQ
ncbi:hypothetical protein SOPP22_10095 [Shewanella sp. OPT22]|nr:hypothetical protein SOPP22_10095 [Shewanella sp. OPT22]